MDNMITNKQKYETYKVLKGKLAKALENGFWLEATMIEYAIMEDRLSSILDHARICTNAYDKSKKFRNKLNSISLQIGKKHPAIDGKITPELLDEIDRWRDDRNTLVHRSCLRVYNSEEVKALAETGKTLVDQLINAAKRVGTRCKKLYGEEDDI